jgi:hypothetical protein
MEEFDKRIEGRFLELDKRLFEIDKRIDSKVELSVRDHLTDFDRRVQRPTSLHKS